MKTIAFVLEKQEEEIKSRFYHPDLGVKSVTLNHSSNMGKPMVGKHDYTNEFSPQDDVDFLLPAWELNLQKNERCRCKTNGVVRLCKCATEENEKIAISDQPGSDFGQLTNVNLNQIVPLIPGNRVMAIEDGNGETIYSPKPTQLDVISSEDDKNVDENPPPSPEPVFQNGCRGLECIVEGDEDVDCGIGVVRQENGGYESPRNSLQRVSTWASLSRTDASSFSSISSLSTNADSSTPAGGVSVSGEEEVCVERITTGEENSEGVKGGAKPKSKGIAEFLTRNLFSWKSKEISPPLSPPSWRLFIKTSPTHNVNEKNEITPVNHTETDISDDGGLTNSQDVDKLKSKANNTRLTRGKRNFVYSPSSTTALILENRPLNLPAKPADEEMRHRHQYEQMIEAMKKRELKEAKLKKRHLQQQLKHEELIVQATRVWNNDVIPNWETMKSSRKARDLWWLGIPPAVRGKVWKLAVGNELNITSELYEICVNRAQHRIRMASESASMSEDESEDSSPDKESSVELIKLDVSRTFPQLCIFQKGGPYYDLLHSLLGAYVCYRPDIGYLQGMSFLAAVLILNLEVDDAFICFANLLNKPCQLAFFRLVEPMMKSYFKTFEEYFFENLPKLFHHFTSQNVAPDLYLIDWIYTLYSKSLPLDVASRVWDVFFRDGEEFLFQTALGILHLYEDVLLHLDFIHIAQFLTKLPDDIVGADLFHSIESIRMNIDKKHFNQVLAFHSELTDT